METMLVSDLLKTRTIKYAESETTKGREIDFTVDGVYSLDPKDNVFRAGVRRSASKVIVNVLPEGVW